MYRPVGGTVPPLGVLTADLTRNTFFSRPDWRLLMRIASCCLGMNMKDRDFHCVLYISLPLTVYVVCQTANINPYFCYALFLFEW